MCAPAATTRRFTSPRAAALVFALTVALSSGVAGCGSDDSGVDTGRAEARAALERGADKRRALERRLAAAETKAKRETERARHQEKASGGPSAATGPLFDADAQGSFDSLAASMPGQIGLAVAPLGSGSVETFGPLQGGHAWSTIKVPILVTLMRERPEGLSSEEQAWAAAALTASDNGAAAALFDRLEEIHGGLAGASAAVGETLAAARDSSTTVAIAPPPPGAVSTYGQTEWTLEGSTAFYRALARDCLLSQERTEYVIGLMEEVVPEQRWGLGEAGFDSSLQVAMKGGWGPESSGYLVRQAGLLRDGASGVAVTIIAQDGTYEAGAADLTRIATWLRENLRGLGGPAAGC